MNARLKIQIYEVFRSQADAAMAIGIREDRLSRIVRGRAEPTRDEKRMISRKLRKKATELFPE